MSAPDNEEPTLPPWEREHTPKPKPTISDYGYLDRGNPVPCSREELIEKCGDPRNPIGYVWVPEHDHLVTVFEAECLFDKIRAFEIRNVRGAAVRSIGLSAVGVVAWMLVDPYSKMLVLLLTAVFGVVPAIQQLWQLRYLGRMKPESMAQWPNSMRYHGWIREQPANVMITLVVVLVVVYLGQLMAGLGTSIYLGGLNRAAVEKSGEYWRAVTATLLHGGTMHIMFNAMALAYLGRPVEVLAGRLTLVLVLVVSMVTGAVFSLFSMPAGISSVGASGGIVGLLGFLIVFGVRYRGVMPNEFTKNLVANVVFIACLGIALSSLIDNGGHLGGLIGGLLCGAVLIPRAGTEIPIRENRIVQVFGWAAVAYLAAAFLFTMYRLSSGWKLPG